MADYYLGGNLKPGNNPPAGAPEHGLMDWSRNWQKTLNYTIDFAELVQRRIIPDAGLDAGDNFVIDVLPAGLVIMSGYACILQAASVTNHSIDTQFLASDLTTAAPGSITDAALTGAANLVVNIAQDPQQGLGYRTGHGAGSLDFVVPEGDPVYLTLAFGGAPASGLVDGVFHWQFGVIE